MSASGNETQDNLAEFTAKVKQEPISAFLGMRLVELAPGHAKVAMKLGPQHTTFTGYIFGGIIASLADQAFACATNSMGRTSIASQFNIHFLSGPSPQDELIAEGKVIKKGRRVDLCEITVTDQAGKLIARATGTAIPMT